MQDFKSDHIAAAHCDAIAFKQVVYDLAGCDRLSGFDFES
jgi:hypothetical protein